jgi:GAF domain-containing protein/HAMP domain-containing protein
MKTEAVKTKRTRNLATSLAFAFFGLSAFVLVLSSSLQIVLNIQSQQAAIASKQQLIAQDASKTVSSFIQEKFSALETAVEFGDPITAASDVQKTFMESLLSIHPSFRQFALLNKQGQQLAQISRVSQSLSPQFSAQLTGDVINQTSKGQRYFSPIYIDDATSEPLIVLAIPIKNVLGDLQGTLIAEVNLKFMWDLVDQLKVGATGYAYVVDNTGTLIAFKDTALVLQGKNVSQLGEVKKFVENASAPGDVTPSSTSYIGLNGGTVVGTYVPLGIPQWAVVIELPWGEAYQDLITLILWSIAIILGIALLASLVGVYVARQTAAPLVELSNIATEVARGNLGVRAKETGSFELAQLANLFNNMTSQLQDSIGNLEERVTDRTRELATANQQNERRASQLQAVAEVARIAASIQGLSQLLNPLTHLISQRFGYYHIGIFLLDHQNQYAILEASNTEGGLVMLKRGHRLKVGEQGIVGFVASRGEPRIALDVGQDAVFFDNPDLPNTRSELALPLKISEQIIGALDLQSTEENAFKDEDISVLAILADQVAIAIQNAQSAERAKRALLEAEIATKQLSGEAWKDYAEKFRIKGYRYDGIKPEPLNHREISEDKHTLLIPVQLRGQTIGRLKLKASDANRNWTEDERAIIASTAERVALAMESARLLDEAQKRATRESFLSEIGTKLGASFQLDSILRDTVEELGQTLKGSTVSFQLVNPSAPPTIETPKADSASARGRKSE